MNEAFAKIGLTVGAGIIGTLVAGPAGGAASCAPAKDYQEMKDRNELTKENVQKFKDAYNEKHN